MKKLKRIAIWGPPSSGKSSLALDLGKQLELTIYHSDIYSGINWGKIPKILLIKKGNKVLKKTNG